MNRNGESGDRYEAEWASRNNGDWSIASYSPFGQTLLQLTYQHEPFALNVKTKQGTILEKLGIDEKGFLTFDGKRLGLKGDEVACFLEMKLPQSWLRQVVAQDQEAIRIEDGQRTVVLRLGKHGASASKMWQLDISWSLYWGFRTETLSLELLREPRLILTSKSFPEISGHMTPSEEGT